jgi:hypothetical protein
MTKLIFDMNSFSPTQGQWWGDTINAGVERRVSLVAAQFGFFLWTADFRDAKTGRIITQKFFCSKVSENEPVALFEDIGERHRWMEEQWKEREAQAA